MAKYKETNDLEGDTSITTEVQQIKIIVRGFFFCYDEKCASQTSKLRLLNEA